MPTCVRERVRVFSRGCWFFFSHVFVHAFIRLFDFNVLNGVNLMTKSTSVFQQPIDEQKTEENTHFNSNRSFLLLWSSFSLTLYVFLCSCFPTNLARFCFLLLMTLIIYQCVSSSLSYVLHKRTIRIVTYMRIMKSSFVVFVSLSLSASLFSLEFFFFFSWLFFFAKKQVLKRHTRWWHKLNEYAQKILSFFYDSKAIEYVHSNEAGKE